MRFKSILIPLLLAQACADAPSSRQVNSDDAAWKGKPISAVIERSGPPSRVVNLPRGEKDYVYESSTQKYEMSHGGYGLDTLNPNPVTCTTDWRVSANGIIESVQSIGSRCDNH